MTDAGPLGRVNFFRLSEGSKLVCWLCGSWTTLEWHDALFHNRFLLQALSISLLIRTISTAFATFLGTLGLTLILATSASAETNQTAATTCVQQWAALVAQGQTDELAKILHESYQHIHGTGLVETKTTFLDALRNGTRKYEPIQLENIKVRSFDQCSIVTAQFNLKATARGKKIEGVYLASFTLIETPQGFFIVSFQATPLKTSS